MGHARDGQELWVFSTLVAGFALSFLVAVVPHFDGAFRLEALMLGAWMIPYVILAVIVWFLQGPTRLWTILSVVGIQLATALLQRVVLGDPAVPAFLLVPLIVAGGLLVVLPQLQGRTGEGLLGPLWQRLAKRG